MLSLFSKDRAKKFAKTQMGGLTVEFVLLVPLVMMLFVASIDFGTYFLKKQNLSSITRGTITIVTNTPGFTIDNQALLAFAQNSLGSSAQNVRAVVNKSCSCNGGIPISCTNTCNGLPPTMFINATLSYDHPLLFPYPGLGSTASVTNSLEFRVQ
jgi:hypothetical protein